MPGLPAYLKYKFQLNILLTIKIISMKSIKTVVSTVMIFVLSLNISFASAIETEPTKSFETEISDLIRDIDLKNFDLEDGLIEVNFLINEKREIIVLSTTAQTLDRAIKTKLNYRVIESKDFTFNKRYTLPVRIEI